MFIYFSSHGSSLIDLPFPPSFVVHCFCSCDVRSNLVYTDVCSDLVFGDVCSQWRTQKVSEREAKLRQNRVTSQTSFVFAKTAWFCFTFFHF